MSNTSQPQLPPVRYLNYSTFQWQIVTDKTGTMYQTLNENVGSGTPWGLRVWRIAPNSNAELIYFLEQGNGILWPDPVTKKLYLFCTRENRTTFYITIDGYIHPADCPDSTVVSIDETQVASLKQSIATAQSMATAAGTVANQANKIAQDAKAQSDRQAAQIAQLQQQVSALQAQVSQLLTPSQVADLVWQKIKDINYLYRLGFNAWPIPAPDSDIRMYINDLVALIRKAK